jgi:selenocysteine lyase/cysteine desulfurase
LNEAISTIQLLGFDNIRRHEKELLQYAENKLAKIPGIELFAEGFTERAGIIPFNVRGIYHEDLAGRLASCAEVRSGCFCAQQYIQQLLKLTKEQISYYKANESALRPGMVRISFGLYNTFEEIDRLIELLEEEVGQC